MKARHQFLQQHKKYEEKITSLVAYNQLGMVSNILALTLGTGILLKFTKQKFVKATAFNIGLFSLFPVVAIVGHWQDQQSKIAEKDLQEYLSNEFQKKQ